MTRPSTVLPRLLALAAAGNLLAGCRTGAAPTPPTLARSADPLVVNTDRGPLAGTAGPAATRAFLSRRWPAV